MAPIVPDNGKNGPSASDDQGKHDNDALTPRSYQIELLNHVIQKNSIICMGTGTGKTFIAIMLIREKAHELQLPFDEGGKRTFFLTNAVALTHQQGEVIKQHTNLKVQTYVGADGVDQWMTDPQRWGVEFRRNQVLVMTAQILLNILEHGLIAFSKINLLIFDECHHAKKNHPYSRIMEIGRSSLKEGDVAPHILGLTASIVDRELRSAEQLNSTINKLERTLNSTAITSADSEAMDMYGTKPTEAILECDRNAEETSIHRRLNEILENAIRFVGHCEDGYKKRKDVSERNPVKAGEIPVGLEVIKKDFDDYMVVLAILGPIAADFVAQRCLDKLMKSIKAPSSPVDVNRRFYRLGYSVFWQLNRVYFDYEERNIMYIEDAENHCPPKVMALIKKILYDYRDEANAQFVEQLGDEEENEDNDLDDFIDDDDDDGNKNDGITIEEENEDDDDDDDEKSNESADDIEAVNEDEAPTNNDLTGIIFVERRIASFALHKLLEKFFGWDPALCCLKSGYIVGGGGTGEDVHNTARHQEATLRAFRKKYINLLVSTSVLQEGIDIPKCNLVVLFDVPKIYREYIQAKGRARAANAKFCVLANEDELDECASKIKRYQCFEEFIRSKCLNREEVTEEPVDDPNEYLPPFKGPVLEDGAQAMVSMSSALSLINQYCSLLPTDSYTRLTTECKFKEYGDSNGVLTYQCTMTLPITSPLRDPVTGPIMTGKKLAQMATALKICEELHKCGELNDNLLPTYRGVENLKELLEVEIKGSGKLVNIGASGDSGSVSKRSASKNKPKRLYNRVYAKALSDCLPVVGKPVYLYEIVMELTAVVGEYKSSKKVPEEWPRGFGLLLSKPISDLPDFPIYVRSSELTVRLKLLASDLALEHVQLENALIYHRYIMKNILNIERETFVSVIFDPDNGTQQVVLVPILEHQIDWEFIDLVIAKKDLKYLTYTNEGKFVWNIDTWRNAVVSRTYREPPAFYFINKICTDMTPNSTFPNENYSTFTNYYKDKYDGLKIKNKKQPLLDVSSVSKRLNLLSPRHLSALGEALPISGRERQLTHFVPEICGIHIFPEVMWRKVTCVPSILYRINCLTNACELMQRISDETDMGFVKRPEGHAYPRLDFGFKQRTQLRPIEKQGEEKTEEDSRKEMEETMKYLDKFVNPDRASAKNQTDELAKRRKQLEVIEKMRIFDDVLDIPDAKYGPSPTHVLQALTMAVSNDIFNLERMEVIGDSFLKYTVTVYLFCKYPDIHEGKLTSRRTMMTCNHNLHKLGCEKNIDELIVSTPFHPYDNWLPPCYSAKEVETVVREGKRGQEDELIVYCVHTKQLMFDKNIADCIEALIGCYLITSGAKAAKGLLSWLGLEVTLNPEIPLPDPVFRNDPDWKGMLQRETSDLHGFEEAIQYKFTNKAYLLEAFTHASYSPNKVTGCYQRLEFLGDAIIDYMITRFLFEDGEKHSPGFLTDLRSALVNNNIFAKLAVKYKYHQFFRYRNSELFYVIDHFVNAQKELGDSIQADIDADLDDDTPIPKALGDIFESVAGAIYLDSGMSLETVWRVYYRMMKDLIVEVTLTLPKSPIRELMELAPGAVSFSRPIRQSTGKMKVIVEIADQGSYSAVAKNHKLARAAAAKKAVKAFRDAAACGFLMGQV